MTCDETPKLELNIKMDILATLDIQKCWILVI